MSKAMLFPAVIVQTKDTSGFIHSLISVYYALSAIVTKNLFNALKSAPLSDKVAQILVYFPFVLV